MGSGARPVNAQKYKVFYCPFLTSDVEAEAVVWATDTDDARAVFERVNPGVVFVRVEETS